MRLTIVCKRKILAASSMGERLLAVSPLLVTLSFDRIRPLSLRLGNVDCEERNDSVVRSVLPNS